VTASPAVAGGVLYDGDWSGNFYAVDAATGAVLWHDVLNDGETVSYGRITASPAVGTLNGRQVVLAAAGATIYALDPVSGAVLASQSLDPRTRRDPSQVVEAESSPTIGPGGVIYSGLDFNEASGVGRAGLVALRLTSSGFEVLWKFDPESGQVFRGTGALTYDPSPSTDFGCGDVWTTAAVSGGLVYFGTANCQHPDLASAAGENWSEEMVAVRAASGTPVWSFRPAQNFTAAWADDDFGASPNVFDTASGARLVGEGQKNAVYWARQRSSGAAAWSQLAGQPGNVSGGSPSQGGNAIGGFIGSTAVQRSGGVAERILGVTALPFPDASDPSGVDRSTWAVRALDPATGAILWADRLAAPAYGPVSVAGGVVFVPDTFSDTVLALDAATGLTLWAFPLNGPPSTTPVVVGDAVYVGAGTGEQGPTGSNLLAGASGIWAFGL
jgi:polyvinyl alcohol dehydrogenase (cytochrome)